MKILVNARIYTMAGSTRPVAAMAWDNDRIARLGTREELCARFPDAALVDARGNTVFPGFIDPHIHFLQGVLYRYALDCTPDKTPSLDALKAAVQLAGKGLENGSWVVGQGYDPASFDGLRPPDRNDLDQACPDNPVVLFHYSLHECVANSKALELAGIGPESQNPPAGEIEKDRKGIPTGRLIETAMEKVHLLSQRFLFAHRREAVLETFSKAQSDLFAKGITRIGDPAVDGEMIEFYREADEKNQLHLPIILHFCSNRQMLNLPWDIVETPRLKQEELTPSQNLIPGPLKIFLDGANRAGIKVTPTAFILTVFATLFRCIKQLSLDPLRVAGRSPATFGKDFRFHLGTLMADVPDGIRLAKKAVNMGFPLCFHAIGNEAVKQALDIIKAVRKDHPMDAPPRIEHAMILDQDLIDEIKALDITIVTQPALLSHMSKDNIPYMPGLCQMPFKSLVDKGIRLSGSSDWPVDSFDPLLAIHHAVTRETIGGYILDPHEALSVEEAVNLYTSTAAHTLGCARDAGTLEPEKRADFIVLDADPFMSDKEIKNINILETWVAGEKVY
ncbi:MAG: amidohydrolase [Desulfobacter sp.]